MEGRIQKKAKKIREGINKLPKEVNYSLWRKFTKMPLEVSNCKGGRTGGWSFGDSDNSLQVIKTEELCNICIL